MGVLPLRCKFWREDLTTRRCERPGYYYRAPPVRKRKYAPLSNRFGGSRNAITQRDNDDHTHASEVFCRLNAPHTHEIADQMRVSDDQMRVRDDHKRVRGDQMRLNVAHTRVNAAHKHVNAAHTLVNAV